MGGGGKFFPNIKRRDHVFFPESHRHALSVFSGQTVITLKEICTCYLFCKWCVSVCVIPLYQAQLLFRAPWQQLDIKSKWKLAAKYLRKGGTFPQNWENCWRKHLSWPRAKKKRPTNPWCLRKRWLLHLKRILILI